MGFLVNVRKKDTLKNICLFVTSTGFQPMTSVMPKAMLYQLLTQDHMSPTNRPLPNEWLHNPVGRALPWHRRGHGIKSRWILQASISDNCLNWPVKCDAHFSIWSVIRTSNISIYLKSNYTRQYFDRIFCAPRIGHRTNVLRFSPPHLI